MLQRKIINYIACRWRIFANYTTLHGVKEIYKAPLKILKFLWLIILTFCAFIMLYQISKLTAHFLTEPVTTTVVIKHEFYQLPLFLLVAHTPDLFFREPQLGNRQRGLDDEAFLYARSLVDKKLILPRGYDFNNGKKKFDHFLKSNPGLTWHDVLEPHVTDLSHWIAADDKLRVTRRSMWHIATYHILEPVETRSAPIHLTHDFVVEVTLVWGALNTTRRSGDRPTTLVLTSYGLLTDAMRLEPGQIYKIRFEMTSQRSVNLRRQPCQAGATQYLMYDQQRCNETCFLRAELNHAPRKCYDHKIFEWGFYELYEKLRPCSKGFFNSSGGPFSVENPDRLKVASVSKMRQAYEKCYAKNCVAACEQLSVKFVATTREFEQDLGNRSLLFVTWPAPSAIQVYEEALQYTWDGFVGQLGGLIGLWMGASMMSAFEAFYLCCCCCYDLTNEEEAHVVERERDGTRMTRSGDTKTETIEEEENSKNGIFAMEEGRRADVWLRNSFRS